MEEQTRPIYLIRFDENRSVINKDVEIFGRVIPKGFITNGASVPAIFRWYMNPYGIGFRAAIVHDYEHILYEIGSKERDASDKRFYKNLVKSGFGKWSAILPFLGVRLYTSFLKLKKMKNKGGGFFDFSNSNK
jgi:hypothetical protein